MEEQLIHQQIEQTPETALVENQAVLDENVTGTDESIGAQEAPEEKTFKQEDVDRIVQKEKAKAEAKAARKIERAYQDALTRINQPKQHSQTNIDLSPKRENFDSEDAWIDAKLDFRENQRQAQQFQVSEQAYQQQANLKMRQVVEKAEELHGFDLDSFLQLPFSSVMADAVMDAEKAPELLTWFGNNPDELHRISKLSTARQAAEIGKIEVKLSSSPRVSNAPPPIKTVGGNRGGPIENLANADMDSYIAMRKKQGARWAR